MSEWDPMEFVPEMERMKLLLPLIWKAKAGECLRYIGTCHTIGPILDPTRYRDGMNNLERSAAVCRAILAAQRELGRDPVLGAALSAATAEIPSSGTQTAPNSPDGGEGAR